MMVRGILAFAGGVIPLDAMTRYVSEDGEPLLNATQLAGLYKIGTRTVYQWRRRGWLTLAGLDDEGRQLYDAGQVAVVRSKPRRRQPVTQLGQQPSPACARGRTRPA